jgi:transmembrane protein 132
MNTAVLTGRQVSQPMKVFMVSQGGEIADVTLHTSCHTSDDSALKVYQIIIFGLFPAFSPP